MQGVGNTVSEVPYEIKEPIIYDYDGEQVDDEQGSHQIVLLTIEHGSTFSLLPGHRAWGNVGSYVDYTLKITIQKVSFSKEP